MKEKLLQTFIAFFISAIAFTQDTIVKADLNTAAKVSGLQFTEPEIDSMLGNVRFERFNIENMHKFPLDNGTPMTLAHSPVLPGMTFNKVQQPINWNIPANVSLPKNKDDLCYYSIL
ncbi:MAG: hypothetical protein H0X70_10910, partial [Segetibacter sp.]|nr:hypothetical protein [Segetibacter sp.]